MSDMKITKAKAWGKIKLLTMVLALLVCFGIYAEWQQSVKPLDTAVVIYTRAAGNNESVVAEQVVSEPVSSVEVRSAAEQETAQQNLQALSDFLTALEETHATVEAATIPASALGQITQKTDVLGRAPDVFEAGKIEIYDSEKGVVAEEKSVEIISQPSEERGEDVVPPDAEASDMSEAMVEDDEIPMPVVEPTEKETVAAMEPIKEEVVHPSEAMPAEIENQAAEAPINLIPAEVAGDSENRVENNVIMEEGSFFAPDTAENSVVQPEMTAENEDGAVDMMKEIMARAQAEGAVE